MTSEQKRKREDILALQGLCEALGNIRKEVDHADNGIAALMQVAGISYDEWENAKPCNGGHLPGDDDGKEAINRASLIRELDDLTAYIQRAEKKPVNLGGLLGKMRGKIKAIVQTAHITREEWNAVGWCRDYPFDDGKEADA